MFSEHYDSRKAHEAGFDAHLKELWQRLLGRPVSEYGFYVIYTHASLVTPDGCVDYLLSKLQR